jgi:rod shape-determining protein MreD
LSSHLRLAAVGVGLLLVQSLMWDLPEALRPDLILIFALAMGLRLRGTGALILAFGFGLMFDLGTGALPGLYAFLRGTACAATRVFDRALYLRAPVPWAIYVLAYCVLDALLMSAVVGFFVPGSTLTWDTILTRLPGMAILTAVLAAPLLGVFQRLDPESSPQAGWGMLARGTRSRL